MMKISIALSFALLRRFFFIPLHARVAQWHRVARTASFAPSENKQKKRGGSVSLWLDYPQSYLHIKSVFNWIDTLSCANNDAYFAQIHKYFTPLMPIYYMNLQFKQGIWINPVYHQRRVSIWFAPNSERICIYLEVKVYVCWNDLLCANIWTVTYEIASINFINFVCKLHRSLSKWD
jgi:hypothetical protein